MSFCAEAYLFICKKKLFEILDNINPFIAELFWVLQGLTLQKMFLFYFPIQASKYT